ncbi:cell wall anchor domain-containing protein [Weissella ceti NC36]|uniref:MucBP domain-containing protein n=1 Tax=Weissella ceti TaxID=759620 RepID=UPI0002AA8721|nr:MucBP domain-containing protein [Weissella ceti]ELA07704.1 cell wall anchor domain-containing protein [Weissella ceti NC36]
MAKSIKKMFIIMMAMVLSFSGVPASVFAADLNPGDYVDKVQYGKEEVTSGDYVSLRVDFSEKGVEGEPGAKLFAAGDTVTLPLPPELKALKQNIKLGEYGEVVVTGDKMVITFNDKATTMEHIKGYFEIELFVERVEDGSEQDVVADLNTGLGTKLKVKGYPIREGGEEGERGRYDFGYKGGNVNRDEPTIIDWYIVANANQDELNDDIIIKDVFGEGQSMVDGTFTIMYEKPEEAEGIKFVPNGSGFDLVISKDFANKRSVQMSYQTKINDDSKKQKIFKNEAEIKFDSAIDGKGEFTAKSEVQNRLSVDGGAEGDQVFELVVEYQDEDGNTIAPSTAPKDYTDGADYTTDPIDIDGYEFVKVDENNDPQNGKINGKDAKVIYVYKKKAEEPKQHKLDVIYVDEEGNEISEPDETKTLDDKSDYKTTQKDIDNTKGHRRLRIRKG